MKFKLSVDDEFKRIAPPMSRSEYEELEKSIMAEGCRDPIVVWNGTILDGHHRYVICRHHDIRFNIRSHVHGEPRGSHRLDLHESAGAEEHHRSHAPIPDRQAF